MAENKLQSLAEIFNQKLFRIPDFQRGYSWELDQLEDLWDDLINIKPGKIHYTGLLTVEPINSTSVQHIEKWSDDLWLLEKGFNAYYLVDGQQRLTTSIILINEVLNKVKDSDGINFDTKKFWVDKFLYKEYDARYKSYVFWIRKRQSQRRIFQNKSPGAILFLC